MGDVGKGPSVYEGRSALKGLHCCWLERVLVEVEGENGSEE